MIKIDLITGFLGSGKTTFIRKYVEYLMSKGVHVGIIENDFGAINVDMLMLSDLEGEYCDIEPIVGGNVVSDWKRRFKAKLISLSMQGFDRVVVEPSGIYDVEAFFDVLYEDPVNSWYEIGNIFTIVDAKMDDRLSEQAEYLMVSQLANCGQVVFSKIEEPEQEYAEIINAEGKAGIAEAGHTQISQTIDQLNAMLGKFDCDRTIKDEVLAKNWDELNEEDYERLLHCGWKNATYKKLMFDNNEAFESLFFMNAALPEEKIRTVVQALIQDDECGTIFRVKGFFQKQDGSWTEVNATKEHMDIRSIKAGQEVVIVIGQDLDEEKIRAYFELPME